MVWHIAKVARRCKGEFTEKSIIHSGVVIDTSMSGEIRSARAK